MVTGKQTLKSSLSAAEFDPKQPPARARGRRKLAERQKLKKSGYNKY
jgi:hypothetical protein